MNELNAYLNDPDFWLAFIALLIIYKVLSFIAHNILEYIKELGVEEYKRNK